MAVDQSFTGTGVALFANGELKKHFQITSPVSQSKLFRQRFIEKILVSTFEMLKAQDNMVEFASEGLAYGAVGKNKIDLAKLLGGIQSRIYSIAGEAHIHEVPPGAWKKLVTGNGRADKKEVIQAINAKYNLNFKLKDNNIADAIGIGLWMINQLKEKDDEKLKN